MPWVTHLCFSCCSSKGLQYYHKSRTKTSSGSSPSSQKIILTWSTLSGAGWQGRSQPSTEWEREFHGGVWYICLMGNHLLNLTQGAAVSHPPNTQLSSGKRLPGLPAEARICPEGSQDQTERKKEKKRIFKKKLQKPSFHPESSWERLHVRTQTIVEVSYLAEKHRGCQGRWVSPPVLGEALLGGKQDSLSV